MRTVKSAVFELEGNMYKWEQDIEIIPGVGAQILSDRRYYVNGELVEFWKTNDTLTEVEVKRFPKDYSEWDNVVITIGGRKLEGVTKIKFNEYSKYTIEQLKEIEARYADNEEYEKASEVRDEIKSRA